MLLDQCRLYVYVSLCLLDLYLCIYFSRSFLLISRSFTPPTAATPI